MLASVYSIRICTTALQWNKIVNAFAELTVRKKCAFFHKRIEKRDTKTGFQTRFAENACCF